MAKDWQNSEGYADPTAYKAQREISEDERRLNDLLRFIKYIVRLAGFELVERIVLRDTRTGIVHR